MVWLKNIGNLNREFPSWTPIIMPSFLDAEYWAFFDWFAAKCEVFHFLLYVVRGKLPGGDVGAGGTQG